MTRSTSIAGSSTAILKVVNNGNAWFLQPCKNRCGYSVLVGQLANDLQRGRKGERMKEEEETTEEKASDGKTSERGFAVMHQGRRTGTATSGEGHERTGR